MDDLQRELNQYSNRDVDTKSLKTSLQVVFERLKEAKPEVQRGILRQLFKEVVVHHNRVKLVWNLAACDGGIGFVQRVEWRLIETNFRTKCSSTATCCKDEIYLRAFVL